MQIKGLKIVKLLSGILLLSFCCGCAGVKVDPAEEEQNDPYSSEPLRYEDPWGHTAKVAPLFSKKVVFPDNKTKKESEQQDDSDIKK